MSCTTLLVGKYASYNGSTMIARNDDSGSGNFTPKKFVVITPEEQKRLYGNEYVSVLSHVRIELPDDPLRYTAVPNALKGEGVWAASGVNECNVGMTATETITSNPRVLGADPLVKYIPAKKTENTELQPEGTHYSEDRSEKTSFSEEQHEDTDEKAGGIGEEDIVTIVLPYVRSAREGVRRLGELLEKYGTYEMNGIAFSDIDDVWIMETVGGHHWIAKRVPDDSYVVMPNQLWIDEFDLDDALGDQREYMCSADLKEFTDKYHLDIGTDMIFNPRKSFGSEDDADHCYNTPRAWFGERYLDPDRYIWDGPDAEYTPESDDIPWALSPEKKITPEDVKYILSSHYQGTEYDPYGRYGDHSENGKYRSIGINRTDFMSIIEIRPDSAFKGNAALDGIKDDPEPLHDTGRPEKASHLSKTAAFRKRKLIDNIRVIEWVAFASNAFNVMVPFYINVNDTPGYLKNTGSSVSTDNFYWTSRLIAALADAAYSKAVFEIERYSLAVQSEGRRIICDCDERFINKFADIFIKGSDEEIDDQAESISDILEEANEETSEMLKKEASHTLSEVLKEASNIMKNQYSRSDC